MTATTKPYNSFAKKMRKNTKRLILQKRNHASLQQLQFQLETSSTFRFRSQCEHEQAVINHISSAAIDRLSDGTKNGNNYETTSNRHQWRSPIGTIADHRMTNNNRIRKQWHICAVIFLSLIQCLVQVTVVNGHPDPEPAPIRVSNSYTKTVSNTIPTSTTSRSTTQITSFLPSDAISSLSSSVINYKNFNAFSGNRSNSGGSGISSGIYSFTSKNVTSITNNANIQSSSRRSASVNTARKDFSSSPVQTSIDRPFYTKLTTNDAVMTPTFYKQPKTSSKKGKKNKNSSKSSSFNKHPKKKESREQETSGSSSGEEIDNDEYAFMPQTTEKSYHPPKLSLEPFFNFLTSLATASREVIMSKEQYHHNNHQPPETSSTTSAESSKYSPSYESINQSIREGAKKSKKSKKGRSKSKKRNKGHNKGSKKGRKGGGKRHRVKSIESLEEDEEFNLDQPSKGAISIPPSNPIIDSPEEVKENDSPSDGIESSGGLHILDVLRTPMIPDYESPSPAIRAEPLVALEYHDSNSGSQDHKNALSNTSSSSTSTSLSGNPPSGRANINKGQGYLKFDKYEGGGTQNMSVGSVQKQQREKQRSGRDPMESFHDQHSGTDLQAQESISHVQVVPSPFGMKKETGLAPSQYQYQQQQPKSNNELSSSFQQVSLTPEFAHAGKSTAPLSEPNALRPTQLSGKNDFVSKYPTTFVYQSNSQPGPAPASRPFMNPSPAGFSNDNAVIYGSPAPPPPQLSSRPPFRMNKLRPNLHSYYDSSYHNYAGVGESQVASEMIGIRHPYGPPHFRPPPHAMQSPFPLPSPPRFVNGYGNRPGFMMVPHRGSHYVGHMLNAAPLSSKEPITKPYDAQSQDYQEDLTGNGQATNNENSSVGNQDISGLEGTGSSSDNIDQYTVSEVDDNTVTAAENSETKKVGIMESFDVFYKEYKILTWVVVFFATSMALLTLLVYLYINNPPTEVVQARQLFPWNDLLKNPQITRFLSSITETGSRSKIRKKATSSGNVDDEYLKPYGKGFGGKSGRQKRKQTRNQQDKTKFARRVNKIKKLNENSGSGATANVENTHSKL